MNARQISIYLLILFVVFFIVTDATQAGQFGRDFFGWIGDGLGQILDFLDSLFDAGDEGDSETTLGLR